MKMRREEAVAGGVFLGLYAALTFPLALWPVAGLAAQAAHGLFALLALALAADLTELVLVAAWRAPVVPRAAGVSDRARAAVLMTVCDDWTPACLEGLRPLAEAGYPVFLLDDSRAAAQLPASVRGCVVHVRRPGRAGAKAGNLNHWLRHHGGGHDHAVVLDADSAMSACAVDVLVRAAEHPANLDVALFQAAVAPAPGRRTLFARALGCEARSRMAVLARVHAPLGLLLSLGHNHLLRLHAVRSVGGFDERVTAEDTTLSFALRASGWRLALVDVWSHDTDPPTVAAYHRRTVRWARQTVELCRLPWTAVPLRLKLLLCRHLLAYALLPAGVLLLAASLWTGPSSTGDAAAFLRAALAFAPGYGWYGAAIVWFSGVLMLRAVLRVALARRQGEAWRDLALHLAVRGAPNLTLAVPLAAWMAATALGRRVHFLPTNSRRAEHRDRHAATVAARWLPAAALVSVLLAGALRHPGALLFGSNLLWLAGLVLSPLCHLLLRGAARRPPGPC